MATSIDLEEYLMRQEGIELMGCNYLKQEAGMVGECARLEGLQVVAEAPDKLYLLMDPSTHTCLCHCKIYLNQIPQRHNKWQKKQSQE